MAEDRLVRGDRDARSANGYRLSAREWLGSSGVDFWLDLYGASLDVIKERMAAEGVL